jgi:polysaccharide export outer membrane protein
MKLAIALLLVAAQVGAQAIQRTSCRPGDGILLEVQNEPTLTDTFTVSQALYVTLPQIGTVSVAGIPREQLTQHFERVLAKYLRHPAVRARVMVRVGVVGEVVRPGYYQVPVDAAFADAVMLAGGATKDAKVRDVFVQRNRRTVLDAAATRAAVSRNSTVDDVAIESGDLITVPRDRTWDAETWVRVTAMVVTIPVAVFTISRVR